MYLMLVLRKEVSSTIFLSLWYEATWNWTLVFQGIGDCLNDLTTFGCEQIKMIENISQIIKSNYD